MVIKRGQSSASGTEKIAIYPWIDAPNFKLGGKMFPRNRNINRNC